MQGTDFATPADALPMPDLNGWLEEVAEGRSETERQLLARAGQRAYLAHQGQVRASGEPYINHVLAVAQIVNKSPSLAAMLLKIVNSAHYGFPSKIDRISRAVTIIGTKEISGLALGI